MEHIKRHLSFSRILRLAVCLWLNCQFLSVVHAQDESDLAKKTQNPVADLISVPLQSNFNFGAGSKDKMIYLLNVQPVIPAHLTDDWNLITRIVMPIINQPSLFPGVGGATGLGESIQLSFFRRPNRAV